MYPKTFFFSLNHDVAEKRGSVFVFNPVFRFFLPAHLLNDSRGGRRGVQWGCNATAPMTCIPPIQLSRVY